MTHKEKRELAQWVIAQAQKHGAREAAVNIDLTRALEIEVRDGKLDRMQQSTQQSLNLDLYVDQRYSSHVTNCLARAELERFIAETVAMTRFLAVDPCRGLPDPTWYQGRSVQPLDLCDPSLATLPQEQKIALARELERDAHARDPRIVSCTASWGDTRSSALKVHSNGFSGDSETTSVSVYCNVSVKDENGRPEGYAGGTTRYLSDQRPCAAIAEEAVRRTLAKLGQKKLKTGRYDLLVENRTVARLSRMFIGPISGQALQQKRSCLDGKLGQAVASEKLSLIDDPLIPRGLNSRHYDYEGFTARRRPLIERGVLKTYLIDTYYARKLGLKPTGGSTANVVTELGTRGLAEMAKGVAQGILITEFIGGNNNPTTGDFSLGLIGRQIVDGQIVGGVNEMNLTGNLLTFWSQLAEVGNDPYPYSSWRMPSMLFKDVQVSGI